MSADLDRIRELHAGITAKGGWKAFIAAAPEAVAHLLAIVDRVKALHKPAKIYDECRCPDGTHPEDYDFIDCREYNGCENSITEIGCQECCVDGDYLTEDCGENHTHTLNPDERCPTIAAITGEDRA